MEGGVCYPMTSAREEEDIKNLHSGCLCDILPSRIHVKMPKKAKPGREDKKTGGQREAKLIKLNHPESSPHSLRFLSCLLDFPWSLTQWFPTFFSSSTHSETELFFTFTSIAWKLRSTVIKRLNSWSKEIQLQLSTISPKGYNEEINLINLPCYDPSAIAYCNAPREGLPPFLRTSGPKWHTTVYTCKVYFFTVHSLYKHLFWLIKGKIVANKCLLATLAFSPLWWPVILPKLCICGNITAGWI